MRIDDATIEAIDKLTLLAPLHQPHGLRLRSLSHPAFVIWKTRERAYVRLQHPLCLGDIPTLDAKSLKKRFAVCR